MPVTPAATPTPTPTATPAPAPVGCPDRLAITPVNSVDWFGCDRPVSGDLKSWTNYIQNPNPPGGAVCPSSTVGTITESGDASVASAAPRTTIASPSNRSCTTSTARSRSTRAARSPTRCPMHGIDEAIGSLADRDQRGSSQRAGIRRRYARRRWGASSPCTCEAQAYPEEHVLDLDLSAVEAVTDGPRHALGARPRQDRLGHRKAGGEVNAHGVVRNGAR